MAANNYRPYLTTEEIEELCTLLAPLASTTPIFKKLYKKLYTLHLKVQSNLVIPGYTTKVSASSLAEKIGLTVPSTTKPAALRKAAYDKKIAGETLSPDELKLAETYEWEHEL